MKKELKASGFDIKALIELFNRFEVEELSLEDNGIKLDIKRDLPFEMRSTQPSTPVVTQLQEPVVSTITQAKAQDAEEKKTLEEDKKYIEVISPMTGTFYRTPAPDEPPFVREGDIVTPAKTICIIEAMKMMNEIKPDVSGKIVKILVENGQGVHVGQILFLMQP
ncbi:MAG: acetyl-CoA carboxylase biotin carboxyl carrier protein [Spirochaetota bacterium]|nr:acetyl-CoA carboxylase biotin carboxyl carrier protein [Spirochaetota bacterium]